MAGLSLPETPDSALFLPFPIRNALEFFLPLPAHFQGIFPWIIKKT
jgi:hypothetical protein